LSAFQAWTKVNQGQFSDKEVTRFFLTQFSSSAIRREIQCLLPNLVLSNVNNFNNMATPESQLLQENVQRNNSFHHTNTS